MPISNENKSNLNEQDLQEIEVLLAFVDFIKNPDKFKDTLEEASVVIAEKKKVVEAFSEVEKANVFLQTAKDNLEKANKTAEKILDEAIDEAEELEEKAKEQEKKNNDRSDWLSNEEQILEDRVKKFEQKEKDLQSLIDRNQTASDRLAQKERDLSLQEEALALKAEKLKEILK